VICTAVMSKVRSSRICSPKVPAAAGRRRDQSCAPGLRGLLVLELKNPGNLYLTLMVKKVEP